MVELYQAAGRIWTSELGLPELLEEYDELMLHIERNEQRRAAEKIGKR